MSDIIPKQLLIQRIGLKSELWGLREELRDAELLASQLLDQLRRVRGQSRPGLTHKAKAVGKESVKLKQRIEAAKERECHLLDSISLKKKALVQVETNLRTQYRKDGGWLGLVPDGLSPTSDTDNQSQESDATSPPSQHEWDLFISHANEDKDEIVRPLVHELRELRVRVWYDESELGIGDSLRRTIDHGLSRSRYGVIVLSPHFFTKHWTEYELNSLTARDVGDDKVILPIWHRVTKDEVLGYSPNLADKLALNSAVSTVADMALDLAIIVEARK